MYLLKTDYSTPDAASAESGISVYNVQSHQQQDWECTREERERARDTLKGYQKLKLTYGTPNTGLNWLQCTQRHLLHIDTGDGRAACNAHACTPPSELHRPADTHSISHTQRETPSTVDITTNCKSTKSDQGGKDNTTTNASHHVPQTST